MKDKKKIKNEDLKRVVSEESMINNAMPGDIIEDIVKHECGCKSCRCAEAEFAEDVNYGVTENTPYHNTAKYTMIAPPGEDEEESTMDTSSS